MGKNAARGMEVLEAILDAGLEVHVQVVVVPGVNDGAELMRTLAWIERHPGVLSAGFVPLGYTRHQKRFTSSFSDDPDAAAAVIELIREFRRIPASSGATPPANCRRVLHRRWLRFSARLHVRGLPAVPGWHWHDALVHRRVGTERRFARGDGRAFGRRTRGVHCLRNGVRPRSAPPSREFSASRVSRGACRRKHVLRRKCGRHLPDYGT